MNKMTIVFKDVTMTNIMQNTDCFERFKVILKCPPLSVETTTPFNEFVGKMRSITSHIAPIAIRDNETGEQWIDDTVQVVSNGQVWSLFPKYLALYGFKEAK